MVFSPVKTERSRKSIGFWRFCASKTDEKPDFVCFLLLPLDFDPKDSVGWFG